MSYINKLHKRIEKIKQGGHEKYHKRNEERRKLFVRKRLELLFDDGLNIEDAFFDNCLDEELLSDGVVKGIGKINGQEDCMMANETTVKAGDLCKRLFEKINLIECT